MLEPWLKFTGICSIVMAIVVFCVIFGGYSSFSRSQNRIKLSKSFLTDACQKRQELLPKLDEFLKTADATAGDLDASAKQADTILKAFIAHLPPVSETLTKDFEKSQAAVSTHLAALFNTLETTLSPEDLKHFSLLKKEFSSAQDYLFVARKRYNKEVAYFNSRTNVFPGFLIAKMFGFNELKYTGISKDKLLSGEKTFMPSTS